jgi:putative transcriptional regulator
MADYKTKVNYKPLWKMLIDRDISKAKLREMTKIAPSTFTKMTNNEYVALDVLVRISVALNCGIDDIVEIEKCNNFVD